MERQLGKEKRGTSPLFSSRGEKKAAIRSGGKRGREKRKKELKRKMGEKKGASLFHSRTGKEGVKKKKRCLIRRAVSEERGTEGEGLDEKEEMEEKKKAPIVIASSSRMADRKKEAGHQLSPVHEPGGKGKEKDGSKRGRGHEERENGKTKKPTEALLAAGQW